MAAIYLASDEESGQQVALKVLPHEFAENPVRLKRFAREARAAKKLDHVNIVRVHDFGFANDTYYIVMEYVSGRDAQAEVQARGPLPAAEVVDILIQSARALSHAYFQGIVHRDIKPSNLLLTEQDGRRIVKLTDFGLALDWTNVDESRLTRQGTTLGTIDYMAPEQARGTHLVDIRGDLYSLGCTAYYLLTARPPFAEGSVPEKMYKHVHETPPDPREIQPDLPDSLITVLGRLLMKSPEARPQSPSELLVELERVQEELKSGKRPGQSPPPREPQATGEKVITVATRPKSHTGSTPLERRKPAAVQPLDQQPLWSLAGEYITNGLVWLSQPWGLVIGLGALLAATIIFILVFWPG
jgi:serine/threonine-protein kinase